MTERPLINDEVTCPSEEAATMGTVGAHRMYEQLTDTAEIFHTTKVLEDLIERLQEEGLLRKKVRIST
jgi:hypothetical protein